MTHRKELETLVSKMNKKNVYTWLETDKDGYIQGVGSQHFKGRVLNPVSAAEILREVE